MENKAEFSTVTISTQHLEDLTTYQANYFVLVNWLEWIVRKSKFIDPDDCREMLELVGELAPSEMNKVTPKKCIDEWEDNE